jgi:uncharacterized protein (TIGR03382 family)
MDGVSPQQTQVFFGNNIEGSGSTAWVSEVQVHPSYYSSQTEIRNDIALIRLSGSPPAGVVPIPALPASLGLDANDAGTAVEFSGFGLTENGTTGRKLRVTGEIGYVCTGNSQCIWYYDNNGAAGVAGHAFGYLEDPGGPCSGDSGGPAFVTIGGKEYVAGVTSYGDENCQYYGVSTLVSAYEDFINDFTGITAEDCNVAGDEDGDGLADCADPDCASAAACQVPDACESATLLSCGAVINDTTATGVAKFSSYSCLNNNQEAGKEKAYALGMAGGAQVTATLIITGPNDLDLFLLPPGGGSCAPGACLMGSTNPNTDPETLSFTVPASGGYLVVESFGNAGSYQLQVACAGMEVCGNGLDDDGDGAVDCADPDCDGMPACQPAVEICGNGLDDDQNGLTDCADATCQSLPACVGHIEICDDGVDNDGDGAADCADPDCAVAYNCQAVTASSGCGGCAQTSSPGGAPGLLPLLLLAFWVIRRRGR